MYHDIFKRGAPEISNTRPSSFGDTAGDIIEDPDDQGCLF